MVLGSCFCVLGGPDKSWTMSCKILDEDRTQLLFELTHKLFAFCVVVGRAEDAKKTLFVSLADPRYMMDTKRKSLNC